MEYMVVATRRLGFMRVAWCATASAEYWMLMMICNKHAQVYRRGLGDKRCEWLGMWEVSAELAPGQQFMLMSSSEIATLMPLETGTADLMEIPPQMGVKYAGEEA